MSATTASDPLASTRLTGPVYVDASALVKPYFPDSDSARLNRRLAGPRDFVASDLAVTEVVSSLARRQRDGMLCAAVVERAQRAELTPYCHRVAESLLIQLTQLPLRAADALYLALTAASDCATMLPYDLGLATVAKAIGLAVYRALRENSIATQP
jgi:predicted nucleic acid-binding protein